MLYVFVALAMGTVVASFVLRRRSTALVSQHALKWLLQSGNNHALMDLYQENGTNLHAGLHDFFASVVDHM
jgi:hypothetical protein